MKQGKVTFLGTGTSQGVPVIACSCFVCKSKDPLDNRLRSSVMLSMNGRNLVIDSGPDFRQQMLRADVQTLDAVVFTHEHKDHMAGLDDVRAFNFKEKKDIPVYALPRVADALKREYEYIFSGKQYPGIPKVNLIEITKDTPFRISEFSLDPIEVVHYKLPVLAYRWGNFTYVTDAKTISEDEIKKIEGTEVLVVNALHRLEHISHFNLAEALAFIEHIQPKRAYLTHISHLMGKHEEISKLLPSNVQLAYDGLTLDL